MAASFASTVVLRKQRLTFAEALVREDCLPESVAEALRAVDAEELLNRVGSAELVQELLRMIDALPVEEAAVPKLRCRIMFRRFDKEVFGVGEEELMRSLSGNNTLEDALLVDDVFDRYLKNDAADFLLSGNDPVAAQKIAGSAMLILRGDEGGLVACGAASVERALGAAYGLDVTKGVILTRRKEDLGASFNFYQR